MAEGGPIWPASGSVQPFGAFRSERLFVCLHIGVGEMPDIRSLEDLKPDKQNPNKGTERGRAMVEDSLREDGAGRSILVDRDGNVIAGNKVLEAAADIGLGVKIVKTQGDELVVVQREDLDLYSEADSRARRLSLRDNRSSELGLEWDIPIVEGFRNDVDLEQLWTKAELKELMPDVFSPPLEDPGPQIDRAAELQEKWQVQRRQVWEIPSKTVPGKCHRLMCGDSTSEEDVARLLAGACPYLMVTDPPYGVEYDPNWRNEAAAEGKLAYAASRVGKVTHDDRCDWEDVFTHFPCSVLYAWSPGGNHIIVTGQAVLAAGFGIRNEIIWAKPHYPISRGPYTYQHEPCWYAVRKGATAKWIGPTNESTLWRIPLDSNVEGGHSTQKPVECMARPIRNHEGDVIDPFLGSGTTMVAAEQTGRVCYGMEIEPKYCSVSLERMVGMGLEPRLAEE